MVAKVLMDVVVWVALWSVSWGVYYILLSKGVNYISQPILTAVYFSGATLLVFSVSGLYKDPLRDLKRLLGQMSWPLVSSSLGLGLAVYIILPLVLPPPHALMRQNPDMFFLPLDMRYLFAKPFDIVFQQALIFMLVVLLLGRGLAMKHVCALCVVLFGLAHISLLGRNGMALGGYFVAFSMLAGWIFPLLMARCRGGIAYTFSLHWIFYVATGAFCRLCPSVFTG